MAYTDRQLRKYQEAGQLQGATNVSNAVVEVQRIHRRSRDFTKVGTENATTNVASTCMFTVRRKAQVSEVHYLTQTNVAGNATDYVFVTITKKNADGTNATTIASYNTHTSAQSTITDSIPAAFSIVGNSDSVLLAGDSLYYTVTKQGAGKTLAIGTITVDLEEV